MSPGPEPFQTSPIEIDRRRFLAVTAGATGAVLVAGTGTGVAAASTGGVTVRLGRPDRGRGGMRLVGFNTGHFMPGGNTAAWIEYANINAVRFFASLTIWCPDASFDDGAGVDTIEDFDRRVEQLRRNSDEFIDWASLRTLWATHIYPTTNHYNLDHQLEQLQRLGITPIMEAAELGWNSPWSGLWLMWQKHYAFTHHVASRWGVERFNFVNEPDHPSAQRDIVDQQVYIRGLQIASDAVRAAIADVNRDRRTSLRAIVQAPVITHASQNSGPFHMDADPDADARDDEHGWGEISLRNLRTDYHGREVDHDIFDVFDTHLYNKTAETYTYELAMIKERMRRYTPTGVTLPVLYSEFNRRNTGTFETSPDDLNTPLVFTELAEIWGAALTGGAEGMICFKFDNTVRSNGIPYGTGHYYVEDSGVHNITGVKKAGESNRMFADRFVDLPGRALLNTSVVSEGPAIRPGVVVATRDASIGRYSIWLPHHSAEAAHPVTLDLSGALARTTGATILVQEVSATHSGDVVMVDTLPDDGVLTVEQPAGCVWLVTVLEPGADSVARKARTAFGVTPSGRTATPLVGRGAGQDSEPAVGYLSFDVSRERPRAALLELDGATTDGAALTFMVYALSSTDWEDDDVAWESAPYLDHVRVRADSVGAVAFPAGQVTAPAQAGTARLDVTSVLSKARHGRLGFLLVREQADADDVADDGRRAEFTAVRLRTWA